MSVMLGVSQTEIAETIARLEKQRIIIKYPALIHWEKVETEQVEALIEVRITPMRDRGFDAVAASTRCPACSSCPAAMT